MLRALLVTTVTRVADRSTCDIKATAFVVWLDAIAGAIADAKANAAEVYVVDITAFLRRYRRLEEAALFAGILRSLFKRVRKSRLMTKRAPAPASRPRTYVVCIVRARLTILTS